MKKLSLLLILILFIGIGSVKAFDNTIKVYDYGQVLTPEEEVKLKEEIDEYIKNYNMDMVIVTVRHHEKNSTMEYADDFYDYNGFGIGNTYDGLIFVIDFKLKEFYISTTGEAIRMYDDNRIESILDDIELYKENYFKMSEAFINSSSKLASKGIPTSNKNTEIDSNGDLVRKKYFPVIQILIIDIIITSITMLILVNKHKMIRKSVNANYYVDKNSLKINNRSDIFIGTHTSSVRINSDSSHTGGSTTHHSSSGRSHGGGGRGL